MFVTDFIQNGRGHGPVGERLAHCRWDVDLMKPYFNEDDVPSCTYNDEEFTLNELQGRGLPVANAASLRKDEWIRLDEAVIKAGRERLMAWGDLAAANTFSGFDGMAKTILEHEVQSDPGEAVVDMDGVTPGRTDSPVYQLRGLPLPITHSDFHFSERRLAQSRNTGEPLDVTMAEAASRRVAEMVEGTLIGTIAGMTYGIASDYDIAPTVWGYRNFIHRITKTDITAPTAGGWTPNTLVNEVIAMRELAFAAKKYGPFVLYHSTDFDQYLDQDYAYVGGSGTSEYAIAPNRTLRDRVEAIGGITAVRRLDLLDGASYPFELLMVQMTQDVARAVIGLNMTTVQWDSVGGLRKNFKVMTIMVPQLRSDINGDTGIIHGTTS